MSGFIDLSQVILIPCKGQSRLYGTFTTRLINFETVLNSAFVWPLIALHYV